MSMIKKNKRQWKIPKVSQETPKLEKEIMIDIKKYLQKNKIFFRRIEGSGKIIHANGRPQMIQSEMSGIPDFLVLSSTGRHIWAEVKREGLGHLSEEQAEFIYAVNSRDGVLCKAGVVCSVHGLCSLIAGKPSNTVIADEYQIPVWF